MWYSRWMPKRCHPNWIAGIKQRDQRAAKNPNWKGGLHDRTYLRSIGAMALFGSPEHRAKMSALAKQRTGEKNPNWKGGHTGGRLMRDSSAYRQRTQDTTRAWNWKKLKIRGGFSEEDYQAFFRAQEGRCAICHGGPNGRGRFHVDHDHQTGTVRGLLCSNCNTGLGMLNDSVLLLETALHYLKKDRTRS